METETLGSIGNVISQTGLGVAAFALTTWLVTHIVKRISGSLDKLVARMESFTDRVRNEHDNIKAEHKALMDQHNEMIKTLGRINGYKEVR